MKRDATPIANLRACSQFNSYNHIKGFSHAGYHKRLNQTQIYVQAVEFGMVPHDFSVQR